VKERGQQHSGCLCHILRFHRGGLLCSGEILMKSLGPAGTAGLLPSFTGICEARHETQKGEKTKTARMG